MDLPTPAGDPLAQATRAQLFELLCDLRRPASTDELAARLKRHPNGIRLHLERLRDSGLVARERSPLGRGRPRDMWLVAAGARPGGKSPTAYAQLGRWLARAIKPGESTLRDVEATGREIGRQLAPSAGGDAESSMYATLAALGFEPLRESHSPQRLTYRLCNCPYREAAAENPGVVCGLHRGVTIGLLDALEASSEVEAFVPRDPTRAGCLIELGGPITIDGLSRLEGPLVR